MYFPVRRTHTVTQHTHTRAADPQRLDTYPRRAVQEMHAFNCRTRAQRGAVLRFVSYLGADMIVFGRFGGALASISNVCSKIAHGALQLWRDRVQMRRNACAA